MVVESLRGLRDLRQHDDHLVNEVDRRWVSAPLNSFIFTRLGRSWGFVKPFQA